MVTKILSLVKDYWAGYKMDKDRERKLNEILEQGKPIKLEIGSGPVKGKNGWTTLDLTYQVDIYWDLLEGIPFPDNTVSEIYSSHVFEHFYYHDLMKLLKDCYRVLKPGGVINACVPDASIYIKAYSQPENFDESYMAFSPAVISNERMDIVNYIAYMDGHHRYMFDQNNLLRVLSTAGFVDIHSRSFDPNLDLDARRYESIYALGYKPDVDSLERE